MQKATQRVGDTSVPQQNDAFQQYRKERHAAHIASRHNLDDLAFKTSERYDQWVLTLAGGALAISLTFIEKIAPEPKAYSWILLGLSWFLFIVAIVAGFAAIFYSREAIYREIEICDEYYKTFRETATVDKLEGDSPPALTNRFNKILERLNTASLSCLGLGTLFMCLFALVNLGGTKTLNEAGRPTEITVNMNLPQITNSMTVTNKGKP
jgi:hypothetical protein